MSVSAEPHRQPGASRRLSGPACPGPEIALLVSTYEKPWHLERVLTSIAVQEGVEGRVEVVVTDDGSRDQTPQIVERFAGSVPFRVALTTHPHQAFQLARCRNEGVRASTAPYLLFLDGDCVLPPNHVREHLRSRRARRVVGACRCSFDEAVTARFDDEAVRSGAYLDWVSPGELRALARHELKSRFYQWIGHPTKPKLLGCNIGLWRSDYERVNGYDENYEGWGCEDDDLRLRLRRAGVRTAPIYRRTRTYHLWHPPGATAPGKWRDGANVAYFSRKGRLTRCVNGLVKRRVEDLDVRVVGATSRPEAAASMFRSRWDGNPNVGHVSNVPDQPEVEFLFLPGRGRFSGRADCNVLVVLDDCSPASRIARTAHVLVADRPCAGVPDERTFPVAEFDRAMNALG
jgi:glycosyltransferase involved in cell wall biosynthesis